MYIARKFHAAMRQKTERVIFCMKVGDYADCAGRLTGAIDSIEGKFGKPLKSRQTPSRRCHQLGESVMADRFPGKPAVMRESRLEDSLKHLEQTVQTLGLRESQRLVSHWFFRDAKNAEHGKTGAQLERIWNAGLSL